MSVLLDFPGIDCFQNGSTRYIGEAGESSGEGFCIWVCEDQMVCMGQFQTGSLTGSGRILYKNGERLEGSFQNGRL